MKRFLARAALVLLVVGLVLAFWAFWWKPRRLVVCEDGTALPCWRGAPLRVAIVSDLHVGSPGAGVAKVDDVGRAINAGRPDLIVLLGDFVIQDVAGGRFVAPEVIADHLRPLRAPLGVYAVLGNHDWWLDAPRVARALTGAGVQVIDDRAVRLPSCWLVGVICGKGRTTSAARSRKCTMTRRSSCSPTTRTSSRSSRRASASPSPATRMAARWPSRSSAVRSCRPKYRQRYAIGHIHEHGTEMFLTISATASPTTP